MHVDGSVDPIRDKETIDLELLFKDMETVEKRLEKLKKQAKSGQKEDQKKADIAQAILSHLEESKPARSFPLETPEEEELMNDLFLLTAKPILYVCNVDEASVVNGNEYTRLFQQAVADEPAEVLLIWRRHRSRYCRIGNPGRTPGVFAGAGPSGARSQQGDPCLLQTPPSHHLFYGGRKRSACLDGA